MRRKEGARRALVSGALSTFLMAHHERLVRPYKSLVFAPICKESAADDRIGELHLAVMLHFRPPFFALLEAVSLPSCDLRVNAPSRSAGLELRQGRNVVRRVVSSENVLICSAVLSALVNRRLGQG